MEDFYFAGGLPAVLKMMESLLHMDIPTVNGETLEQNIINAKVHNEEVIRPINNPIAPDGGTTVLKGNLAPNGAVIKHSAADPSLLKHSGPAIVFDNYRELSERIDDPDLPVTKESVLVLRNAGPVGAPGMPEWGMLPIPKKLLKQGVRDMVRVSDARMSGTSYGTCVLHVTPESAIGGPLATIKEGDIITIDGGSGKIMKGLVPTVQPEISGYFSTIMKWADEFRKLKVRTNAETEADSKTAREFGAEGIGLCRTEHMFFDEERILSVRQMILSKSKEDRNSALDKLLPHQKEDFKKILKDELSLINKKYNRKINLSSSPKSFSQC